MKTLLDFRSKSKFSNEWRLGSKINVGFIYLDNFLKQSAKDRKTGATSLLTGHDYPKKFLISGLIDELSVQVAGVWGVEGLRKNDEHFDNFGYGFFNLAIVSKPVSVILTYNYIGVPYYLGEDRKGGRLTLAIPFSKNYAWQKALLEAERENVAMVERAFQTAEGSFHRSSFDPGALTIGAYYCNNEYQTYYISVPVTSRIGIIADYSITNGKKLGTLNLILRW